MRRRRGELGKDGMQTGQAPVRPRRLRPHWRRGVAFLVAAGAMIALAVWWSAAADAPQQRAEQHGVATTAVVTGSHTDTDSGDHRVCVRYTSDRYAVSVCPWASEAKPTGATVQVKYLPSHPTTAVIEGDAGSDSGTWTIPLLLSLGLALAGASDVIGRRAHPQLAGVEPPNPAGSSGVGAVGATPADDPEELPSLRTVSWAWVGLGLRGRYYALRDTGGAELGTVRLGHLGFLRSISTPRSDYRARTLGIPGRIRIRHAAGGALVMTWYRGRRGVEVEGGPTFRVDLTPPAGGRSPTVDLIGADGSTVVRAWYDLPLHALSLRKAFPYGSAQITPGGVGDELLLAVLAFQVLAIALSPSGG